MAEEVSPESKLYVKEEIERTRKEFKEDLEKAQSRATKTFATVALVVGLLGSLGIYGLVKSALNDTTIKKIESEVKKSLDNVVEYEKQAQDIVSYKVLVGTIVPYGGDIKGQSTDEIEVDVGWLFCNGAGLNREEYKELFSVIGTAFGAPDPKSFNLPDLRGRFLRGVDHGTRRDPDADNRKESAGGGYNKDRVGSLQDDEFKLHSHEGLDRVYTQCADGKSHYRPIPGPTGGAGGKETRPKNIYVNWIIKAK